MFSAQLQERTELMAGFIRALETGRATLEPEAVLIAAGVPLDELAWTTDRLPYEERALICGDTLLAWCRAGWISDNEEDFATKDYD